MLRYGSTQLRRLVAEQSGLSPEVVHDVLDAYDRTVKELVESGVWVWVADLGHLVKVERAASRRRNIKTGQHIEVPSKSAIVLREPKPKKKKPNVEKPDRDS
jgi:nucleoid DNA-binding protein